MSNHLSSRFFGFLVVTAALVPTVSSAKAAQTYYVNPDQNVSSDSYDGKSPTHTAGTLVGPWRSQTNVQNNFFQAGDTIKFIRGATFTGGLNLTKSGSPTGGPITYTNYGSGTALPIFKNGTNIISDDTHTGDYLNSINVMGKYIVVDGLSGQAAHFAGIYLTNTAGHVTVKNCYFNVSSG